MKLNKLKIGIKVGGILISMIRFSDDRTISRNRAFRERSLVEMQITINAYKLKQNKNLSLCS